MPGTLTVFSAGVPTSTSSRASATTVTVGQLVTLTATVVLAPPNAGVPNAGAVTFMDGSTPLGSPVPLDASGQAMLQVSTLTTGCTSLRRVRRQRPDLASTSVFGSNSVIAMAAGNGVPGCSGDNGPATAAELDIPTGVAVDAAGDLFIADYSNNRIREVNHATGTITTVAGSGTAGYGGDNGQATAAKLNEPQGVAVDAPATCSSPTPATIGSARSISPPA